MLEPKRIQRADRKDTDAALRASWTADEPMPAAPGRVGERGIDDLDETLITSRQRRKTHGMRITRLTGGHTLRRRGAEREAIPGFVEGATPAGLASKTLALRIKQRHKALCRAASLSHVHRRPSTHARCFRRKLWRRRK